MVADIARLYSLTKSTACRCTLQLPEEARPTWLRYDLVSRVSKKPLGSLRPLAEMMDSSVTNPSPVTGHIDVIACMRTGPKMLQMQAGRSCYNFKGFFQGAKGSPQEQPYWVCPAPSTKKMTRASMATSASITSM